MPFAGFQAEDFDAYLPEKWSSNMFTLPRRKVREKLDAIGGQLAAELAGGGLPLVQHLSDDHPTIWNNKKVEAQWLFYSRDESSQKRLAEIIDTERTLAADLADPAPLYRHVFIGVAVDRDHLEIGLRLHHDAWVDRRNLLTLIADDEGRGHFHDLLASLPPHYEIGLMGGEMAPVGRIDEAGIAGLAARFEEAGGFLFIGARLPRDQVLVLGEEIGGMLLEAVGLLAPVYRFVAWSPENDTVSLDNLVVRRREAIRLARDQFAAEREERRARRDREEAERRERLGDIEERVRVQEQWRARERMVRRSAARAQAAAEEGGKVVAAEADRRAEGPRAAGPAAERPRERPENGAAAQRPERDRATRVPADRAADIQVGDRVEVVSGFLKGRIGVVQEIDDRGGLRIAFGSLSSRLDRADVRGHGPAHGGRG